MKRSHRFLLIIMLLVPLLSGCISNATQENESTINVVVSIAPYFEWVERVGGENVNISILVPEGSEPHTYEPTPDQLIEINNAKLWIKNGVGLEKWADKFLTTNKNMVIVDISEGVDLIPVNDGYDPHVWLSPKIAIKGVAQIYDAMVKIDPKNENYYALNKEAYMGELLILDQNMRAKLENLTNNKFIVFHPAWTYFCREYGLEQIAIEQEGKEPSPKDIVAIIELAKEFNIRVIFVEPQFNPKSAEIISKEINGIILTINPLSQNYIDNLNCVVESLIEGLTKQ